MLSLSLAAQSPPNDFHSHPKWSHLNPFSLAAMQKGRNSKTQERMEEVETRPISFATQLTTCGVDQDITNGIVTQWTREASVGSACQLGKGLEARVAACLPENPLNVPHIRSPSSICIQATLTRTATVLEAVSHWSNQDEWLACGLRQHLQNAFIAKFHTDLETDDLRERRENALDSLVEAYASPDG